jgi:type I restriction enzyme S subunit
MTNCQEMVLGEALTVRHGFAFQGEYFRDAGELIVLTPGNFQDDGGFKAKNGTEKYYQGPIPVGYLLKRGDVIVAMTEQAEGLLGSTATVPESDKYLHNQRIGLLQITQPERLDLRFCYHLFNSASVRRRIRATATGSKVRHTAPERLRSLAIPVPPLREQQGIACVLDALDDLIGNNERRIALLEQMAEAMYRDWCIRFLTCGSTDQLASNEEVPLGWRIGTMGDIAESVVETIDPGSIDGATPAVGLEHMPRHRLTLAGWGRAGELHSRKARLREGDILFGKIRPYFHKVCVAPLDGICSTDVIVLRPSNEYWGLVVMTAFSDVFVSHAVQTSNGTKMPRADWKVLKDFPILIPPVGIAHELSLDVADALGQARVLMLQNRQLSQLRYLLLPKLVTGQIDVSGLDLDSLETGGA